MPIANSFAWSTATVQGFLSFNGKETITANGTPPSLNRKELSIDHRHVHHTAFVVNNTLIPTILLAVLVTYLILTVILFIKRRLQGKVPLYVLKWPPALQSANPVNAYIITIVTGSSSESRAEAVVGFSLHGHKLSSESYFVNRRGVHLQHKLLSRGSNDRFLVISDQPLGIIQQVRVRMWATDPNDNWHLSYVTVLDVKRNTCTYFPIHGWISARNGEGKVINASNGKSLVGVFADNICVGFTQRHIWTSVWLSSSLLSSAMYSFILCYLTIAAILFSASVYFYSAAYGSVDRITTGALVFIFSVTLTVTIFVSLLQGAMRMMSAEEVLSRYSSILICDSSVPQERWLHNSRPSEWPPTTSPLSTDAGREDHMRRPEVRRTTTSGGMVHRALAFFDGRRAQQSRTNCTALPQTMMIEGVGRKRSNDCSNTGEEEGEEEEQRNNNNRTVSSRSLFPGISSCTVAKQSSVGNGGGGGGGGGSRDNFSASFSSQSRPEVTTKTTTMRSQRSSSIFSSARGQMAPSDAAVGRRLNPYGVSLGNQCNSCRNPSRRTRLQSFQTPPAGRSVVFRYPVKFNSCPKYSAKTTTSECCHSILTKSEDFIDDAPFSPCCALKVDCQCPRSIAPAAKGSYSTPHYEYDCPPSSWRLNDPKEDVAEQNFRGFPSTKKFSISKHPHSSGRCNGKQSGGEMTPGHCLLLCSGPNDPFSCCADNELNCDRFPTEGCAQQHCLQEVQHNWNALWTSVGPEEDGERKEGACLTSAESNCPADDNTRAAAELREISGQLIEEIIHKIKQQLANPEDHNSIDLSACEFDLKSFAKKIGERANANDSCDHRRTGAQRCCQWVSSASVPATPALDNCCTINTAAAAAGEEFKNSLTMLDQRVAAVVCDIGRVREQLMKRMCQELGLEDDKVKHAEKSHAKHCGGKGGHSKQKSSSSSSSSLSDSKQKLKCEKDKKKKAKTKIARSHLNEVLSSQHKDAASSAKQRRVPPADLKAFADGVVHSLYAAVRSKLRQLLDYEHDLSGGGGEVAPFPTEELLRKADHEVKEQVLPTVAEHIVWLMREEGQTIDQLDCDMMMIAFAGQYVDTIVTNAVLKTNVDLTKKRAYTRTFVVTSDSNKANKSNNNNNNSNRLGSVAKHCLETHERATVFSADVLSRHKDTVLCCNDDVSDVEQQILFQVRDKLMRRISEGTRCRCGLAAAAVESLEPRDPAASATGGSSRGRRRTTEAEGRSDVGRCLTVSLLSEFVVAVVLEEAIRNLETCAEVVQREALRQQRLAKMVSARRSPIDGAKQTTDRLVSTEMDTKAVGYLETDRNASTASADDRRKLSMTADLSRTEEGLLDPRQEDARRRQRQGRRRRRRDGTEEAQTDHEMFCIGNSLTRLIVDEDEKYCRCHGNRSHPVTLPSVICQKHGKSNLSDEDLEASGPGDGQTVAKSLEGLDRKSVVVSSSSSSFSVGDFSRSRRRRRRLAFLVVGHLLWGLTLFAAAFLTVDCVVLGSKLNSTQAKLWLSLSLLGMLLQLCVFETIKILVLALYWTLLHNDLMR